MKISSKIGSFPVILAISLAFCWGMREGAAFGAELKPGAIWNDTDGKPINAHGGGVLYYNGAFYWYGEYKTGKTFLPVCNKTWGGTRVDTVGVSCYSSKDLCDWKNEGIVLPSVKGDPQSDLDSSKVLERPKVIYNKKTGKFVMWMHIDTADYSAARAGVAVSDKPTGPFSYLGSFRPDVDVRSENIGETKKIPAGSNPLASGFEKGQMCRDLTVFVDDDGKAYLFYSSEENSTMHVSLLTDDYLRPAGRFRRIFIGRSMEAPAVFKHSGKYYLIASGCTAWAPNAARLAVANNIFGPWTELGNPCVGVDSDQTFHSQSTFVLGLQGRDDAFVFMADRWKQWDLPDSRYIWLPLEFDTDGKPFLRWQDQWSSNALLSNLKAATGANTVALRLSGR